MSSTKERVPEKTKLFAADMWAVFNFGDPNKRYQKFLTRGRPAFKLLTDGVLLYDEIIIPTQDFMSLSILVGVLGERAILDLLEAGCLRFLRLKGALAYIGNGGGIKAYEISSHENQPIEFCAPVDTAVARALDGLSEKPKDPQLPRMVLQATEEVSIGSIMEEIRHETYMDVLDSPYLRNLFALGNRDMDRLTGIKPNEVRIYGGPDADWQGDEIDIVMSLATANIELRLAQSVGCADSSTASPVGHLIKAKAERTLEGPKASEAFAVLREITNIPDIGEGVLEKQITVSHLLKLKQSRNGRQFREWFHKNCRKDPIATAREYTTLLREVPKIQSLPIRVLRFIVTTTIGAIPGAGMVLGPTAGAIDSFFIENILRGSSPKFFIEDLRQLQGKPL